MPAPAGLWLTRGEAARYVGVSSEAAIRAAEAKGLEAVADANNQFWLSPATLDGWPWRGAAPTIAQKTRVFREALKARQQEARARERQEEADRQREEAEWDAQLRGYQAEDDLRASVRRKARDLRALFESDHMDERTTAQALGFKSYETWRLRDLVNGGLLRRVESPPEPRVEMSFDGAREVESQWPLCSGGPFFRREEVLELRRESEELAERSLRDTPTELRRAAQIATPGDVVAELLRAWLEGSR